MSDSPTYASLTPLAPSNPTMINGLAEADVNSMQMNSLISENNTHMEPMDVMPPQESIPLLPSLSSSHNILQAADIKSEVPDDLMSKDGVQMVLQFLRKNNLKNTEDILKKEWGLGDSTFVKQEPGKEFVNSLASYKNEGDPTEYEDSYQNLVNFVERCMDAYKYEVAQIIFPVFVHMYLELVYNEHETLAVSFLERFSSFQEDYYQEDILGLSLVTKKEHMTGYQIMDSFRTGQYMLQMSRDSYSHVKRFLNEYGGCAIARIIQDRLTFDIYDGIPRTKNQVMSTAGALEGESAKQVNRSKIYFGLLKEPDIQVLASEEDENEDEVDKPKKKKARKDQLQKTKKNDPNAPANNRIPLPDLREMDKLEKAKALKEAMKRITLGRECLPSICFYTFLNASSYVTALDVTDDSSLLAYGTGDSVVAVHSITPTKLKAMKSADQLSDIDKYSYDVLVRMMDERSADVTKYLYGHNGPVYSCSFSPDRTLLLTASQDGTIRLWSLQTWTCLVIYKGHVFPVWDVKFCPMGYYFVSCGKDRTVRLWATDHHQPLRIFAGHHTDVDVVEFHPNCNYICSGSSDRSIRLWDTSNGNCVRILTGHKGMVTVLKVSPCGRFLASGSSDQRILVWDLAQGNLIAEMASHHSTIHTICFSRDGNLLSSGGLDCCVKLWDFAKVVEDINEEDSAVSQFIDSKKSKDQLLLATYPTKSTPVLATHFTRRNVLLTVGSFES